MRVSTPVPVTSPRSTSRKKLRLALAFVGGVVVTAPIALVVIARLNTIPPFSQAGFTRRQVGELLAALHRWADEHGGRYPVSLDALLELDAAGLPFLRNYLSLPVDGWGNPFVHYPSAIAGSPRIVSYGADGKPGGTGADRDIDSATFERD